MPPTPVSLDSSYRLDRYTDTYALGHYARVLDAYPAGASGVGGSGSPAAGGSVAFKVLRPEHAVTAEQQEAGDEALRWEIRAFAHEADLLIRLADSPHLNRLLDCGFVSDLRETPQGGECVQFGRDAAAVAAFGVAMAEYAGQGWRPYLALEYFPRADNLFYAMRADRVAAAAGQRRRLPTEEGLAMALQWGETLRLMHSRHIAYLDHKLEHVFWDGATLRVIDLNSSRLLERAQEAGFFALDVHHLCVGILYPAFTGLAPQKGALRPQPGNLAEVERRYQDVVELDFGVEPSLSPALIELLQAGAAHEIADADDFPRGLHAVASQHGWDFPGQYTVAANREARAQMRAGLTKLRRGEEAIREARDLFRDAAVQHDDLSPELEAEFRRLVKAVNEMLAGRVVP